MSDGCREGKEREEEGDGDWEMHHSMMFKADDDGVVAVFVKLQQEVFFRRAVLSAAHRERPGQVR